MPESRPPNRIYKFGEFRLVTDERMLMRENDRIPLTPRLFDVLLTLVENAGRLVTKKTLMDEVWADSFVEEGNLNSTMSRLRKILGEKPSENRFIETVPRVGYRFIADVEVVEGGRDAEIKPIRASGISPTSRRRNPIKWLAFAVILALLTIASASILYLKPWAQNAEVVKPQKQTPIRLTDVQTRVERPVFTPEGGIRFVQWDSNIARSYVMNADGTNPHRDTSIAGLRVGSWSPDGKKVIFYREGDDQTIFLANADGSNEVKLPFMAGNIAWSQDSGQLVYQFSKTSSDIYLYTLATREIRELVTGPAFDTDASLSPDGKSLVYVSDSDGNAEIYIQDLDGSNLRRLTNHPAHDEFPTFSSDGTQIVFNSNREDENFDIFIMNTDGSGVRKLTNWKSQEEIRPYCWSADGTKIIFVSDKEGRGNLYVMDVEPFSPAPVLTDSSNNLLSPTYSPDGKNLLYVSEAEDKSGEMRVVDLDAKQDRLLLNAESADMFPRFSPDGNRIVFQNRIEGDTEICVISSNGGEVRNLTNNPARDAQPAWSPDGSKIVFVSNREGNYDVFSLFTMNADGSSQHRIYYSYAVSGYPSWSPDGRQVVFSNDKEDGRTGNFEIFAIEPETTNAEKRLTFRRRYDVSPVFSPDGGRIAFVSNGDGNSEIYLMNADGSGLLRLTRDLADDRQPSWSPDGKRIIFTSNRNGKFAIFDLTVD